MLNNSLFFSERFAFWMMESGLIEAELWILNIILFSNLMEIQL